MTDDDLRTCIAAVLFRLRGMDGIQGWDDETEECREMWRRDADAVIADLDSRGWLIDPESEDRRRRARNKRWLEGDDDHD